MHLKKWFRHRRFPDPSLDTALRGLLGMRKIRAIPSPTLTLSSRQGSLP